MLIIIIFCICIGYLLVTIKSSKEVRQLLNNAIVTIKGVKGGLASPRHIKTLNKKLEPIQLKPDLHIVVDGMNMIINYTKKMLNLKPTDKCPRFTPIMFYGAIEKLSNILSSKFDNIHFVFKNMKNINVDYVDVLHDQFMRELSNKMPKVTYYYTYDTYSDCSGYNSDNSDTTNKKYCSMPHYVKSRDDFIVIELYKIIKSINDNCYLISLDRFRDIDSFPNIPNFTLITYHKGKQVNDDIYPAKDSTKIKFDHKYHIGYEFSESSSDRQNLIYPLKSSSIKYYIKIPMEASKPLITI